MKKNISVLYIDAMGPCEKFPNRGIFVTQRIRALKAFPQINVIPVSLFFTYSWMAKFLLRVKSGVQDQGKAISQQMDILYDVFEAKYSATELFLAGSVTPKVYYAKSRAVITQMLQKYPDIQLIHMHWMWPCGMALPEIAKEHSIPYIITCHGSEINITMRNEAFRKEIIHILESAYCVEFVSRALLNTAMDLGYSGKNAAVVHNGIDVHLFHGKRASNRTNTVGFVGNLISVKGADRLPELFHMIHQKMQGDVEFLIAGDGALRQSLEHDMAELPVTFCGFVPQDQLAELYAEMDVLLMPSRNEGYACVIKEAQACGVIPVVADVGGLAEAVGEYGSVVPSNDGERALLLKLAEAAADYLQGKAFVDMDHMIHAAKECSWVNLQKKSVDAYCNAAGD